MPTESSVLTNLRELEKLETDRIADEKARRAALALAAVKAEAEAKAKVEAEEARARQVAEAEVRLNLEKEREARNAEAELRLATLRAELAAVQADRERMHARIVTAADDTWATRPPRAESWGWKAAFASAGAVAAGLALILAIQQPAPQTRIVEVPVERTVIVEAPVEEQGGAPELVAEETTDDGAAAAPAGSAETPTGVVRPNQRPDMRPRPGNMEPDPFADFDCPDDDPICAL